MVEVIEYDFSISDYGSVRGFGRGRGGSRQGIGPTKYCVCPECGARIKHKPNVPCTSVKCPLCGTRMYGSDTGSSAKKKIE